MEASTHLGLLVRSVHDHWGSALAWEAFERLMTEIESTLRAEIAAYEYDSDRAQEVLQETWTQAWYQLSPQQTAKRASALRQTHTEYMPHSAGQMRTELPEPGFILYPKAYFRRVARTLALERRSPEVVIDLTDSETPALILNDQSTEDTRNSWFQWFTFVDDLAQCFGVDDPHYALDDLIALCCSGQTTARPKRLLAAVLLACADWKPRDIAARAKHFDAELTAPQVSQLLADARRHLTRDHVMLAWVSDSERPWAVRFNAASQLIRQGWTLSHILQRTELSDVERESLQHQLTQASSSDIGGDYER